MGCDWSKYLLPIIVLFEETDKGFVPMIEEHGSDNSELEDEEWIREAVYYPLPLFLSASGESVVNPNFSSKPFPHRWNYKRRRRYK